MNVEENRKIYCSFFIILTLLIPSYFTYYGALLIKWYFGFSIATVAWQAVSKFTFNPYHLMFEIIIFLIGIFSLMITLKDKKKNKKDDFDKRWIFIGVLLILVSILHSVYYYIESYYNDPNLLLWIPIKPIILIVIGFYIIKSYNIVVQS